MNNMTIAKLDRIVVSDSFSREERRAINSALNDIWHIRDREGKILISQAVKWRGTLSIIPTKGPSGIGLNGGQISINFDECNRLLVKENSIFRHVGITSVLVHELYHAADPNTTDWYMEWKLQRWLSNDLNHDFKKHVPESLIVALKKVDMVSLFDRRDTVRHALFLSLGGYEMSRATQNILMTIPTYETTKLALSQSGIISPSGFKKTEETAVSYTDALMQKNFGQAEPVRRLYNNLAVDDSTRTPPITLRRTSGKRYSSPGFHAYADIEEPDQIQSNRFLEVMPYKAKQADSSSVYLAINEDEFHLGSLKPNILNSKRHASKLMNTQDRARRE